MLDVLPLPPLSLSFYTKEKEKRLYIDTTILWKMEYHDKPYRQKLPFPNSLEKIDQNRSDSTDPYSTKHFVSI